jgi:hypothetical protein
MKTKETMTRATGDQRDENTVHKHVADDAAKVSRRRALLAGLAAAPAVLSLMNRSAWGGAAGDTHVSCTLVSSYVNAGNYWSSPRPSNGNGTLVIKQEDVDRCG